jgi:hypothetical protein
MNAYDVFNNSKSQAYIANVETINGGNFVKETAIGVIQPNWFYAEPDLNIHNPGIYRTTDNTVHKNIAYSSVPVDQYEATRKGLMTGLIAFLTFSVLSFLNAQ